MGGALLPGKNRLGMVLIITSFPPQHLQIPGCIPILSKAISCHGFLVVIRGRATFKEDLMSASDFLFDALERNP